MDKKTLDDITTTLKDKYSEVGIRSIEVNDQTGQATFYLNPTQKSLAFIEGPGGVIPRQFKDKAATVTRDALTRTDLDLIQGRDPYEEDPKTLFERAIRQYYVDPIVGASTNVLANLASRGFEHDIDDLKIKQFYDYWAQDTNFFEMIEWIYLDFFKYGNVTTYKVLAKYEPRVSHLSPIPGQKSTPKKTAKKETGAKKNIWSKGHLPVSYTVLNPLLVNVEGNLLFDNVSVTLTPPPELRELLAKPSSEQTEDEKALIKALPSDLKAAAEGGGDFRLDPRLVGSVTYRKQPYERYARPKITKVMESLEYKRKLRQADLSTLDGISNYILKVTVGNDTFPVTSQTELEAVAALFNTTSKAFDVVWNHTLDIQKIVSPEIENILGQEKYEQVNDDIGQGVAVPRALLDGGGVLNQSEAGLVVKSLEEEINYARRQVTRWIYKEYQQIAEAMKFDRYPKIRWDESILKDTIMYMNTLAQLVDRRMLSYRTAHEALGFDYENELENMTSEVSLVEDGTFGIIGSPWQQAKGPQATQGTPTGTPSAGRPKGRPAKTKQPEKNPQKKNTTKTRTQQKPKKTASLDFTELVKGMTDEEYAAFLTGFVQEMTKARNEE